jgi:hypothetical protein
MNELMRINNCRIYISSLLNKSLKLTNKRLEQMKKGVNCNKTFTQLKKVNEEIKTYYNESK